MIDVWHWHTHCIMYIFISAAAYYLPALLVMKSKKGRDALISFLLARACNKPQHNLATSAPSQLHHPFLVFPWAFLKFNGNSEKDLGTSREHDSILLWKEMKKENKKEERQSIVCCSGSSLGQWSSSLRSLTICLSWIHHLILELWCTSPTNCH